MASSGSDSKLSGGAQLPDTEIIWKEPLGSRKRVQQFCSSPPVPREHRNPWTPLALRYVQREAGSEQLPAQERPRADFRVNSSIELRKTWSSAKNHVGTWAKQALLPLLDGEPSPCGCTVGAAPSASPRTEPSCFSQPGSPAISTALLPYKRGQQQNVQGSRQLLPCCCWAQEVL